MVGGNHPSRGSRGPLHQSVLPVVGSWSEISQTLQTCFPLLCRCNLKIQLHHWHLLSLLVPNLFDGKFDGLCSGLCNSCSMRGEDRCHRTCAYESVAFPSFFMLDDLDREFNITCQTRNHRSDLGAFSGNYFDKTIAGETVHVQIYIQHWHSVFNRSESTNLFLFES